MIKVTANNGEVIVKRAEGTALILMTELCCIVKAVCTGFCKDEENSEAMIESMVIAIADALKCVEIKRRVDLEDDENADF